MFAPVSYLEWEHDGARQAQAQKDWLEADARWEACDGSHVLREMAEGKSNSSIAADLHLSESSVEKYVNSIFSKLGLEPAGDDHRRVDVNSASHGASIRVS